MGQVGEHSGIAFYVAGWMFASVAATDYLARQSGLVMG